MRHLPGKMSCAPSNNKGHCATFTDVMPDVSNQNRRYSRARKKKRVPGL